MIRRFTVHWGVGPDGDIPEYVPYDCTFERLKAIIKEDQQSFPYWTLLKVEEVVTHTLEIDIKEFK